MKIEGGGGGGGREVLRSDLCEEKDVLFFLRKDGVLRKNLSKKEGDREYLPRHSRGSTPAVYYPDERGRSSEGVTSSPERKKREKQNRRPTRSPSPARRKEGGTGRSHS